MIHGLLLAAGSGSRFGGDKLLCPLRSGSAIGAVSARHLLQVLPQSIAIVREDDTQLASLLAGEGLRVVVCRDAREGMGRSIACGVAASSEAAGWVVALADMPGVQPASISAVARAIENGAAMAAAEFQGRRGHPVGFSADFRKELLQLHGDTGARTLLARHQQRLVHIELDDPGVLFDIDTRADAAALAESQGSG